MPFTRLSSITKKTRALDDSDIRAAISRVCEDRWKTPIPIQVERISRGVAIIKVPSSPWRSEILWNEEEILSSLDAKVPGHSVSRILPLV